MCRLQSTWPCKVWIEVSSVGGRLRNIGWPFLWQRQYLRPAFSNYLAAVGSDSPVCPDRHGMHSVFPTIHVTLHSTLDRHAMGLCLFRMYRYNCQPRPTNTLPTSKCSTRCERAVLSQLRSHHVGEMVQADRRVCCQIGAKLRSPTFHWWYNPCHSGGLFCSWFRGWLLF